MRVSIALLLSPFLVVMFIAIAGAVLGFTVQKPKLAPTTAVETTIERAEEE